MSDEAGRAPDNNHANVDVAEIAKFDALAARWWDPSGEFRPLHEINPLRLDFIDERAPLRGQRVVDVGLAVFGDAGQVFSKRDKFKWEEMRGAAGFGLRIKNRNAVVMRLDTGFSREGFQIWFKFGNAF
jgi:hypothetical protein